MEHSRLNKKKIKKKYFESIHREKVANRLNKNNKLRNFVKRSVYANEK